VDLERALETQRVALLRLLSGWFAVIGFLSSGPFALAVPCSLPQWICKYFDMLLTRAEFAAQCLVQASISLQGGHGHAPAPEPMIDQGKRGAPSFEALLRRMTALRDLLENLSRTALARIAAHLTPPPYNWQCRKPETSHRDGSMRRQWFSLRLARPPDIHSNECGVSSLKNSLPLSGREALAVGLAL